jgi:hypothetical protein
MGIWACSHRAPPVCRSLLLLDLVAIDRENTPRLRKGDHRTGLKDPKFRTSLLRLFQSERAAQVLIGFESGRGRQKSWSGVCSSRNFQTSLQNRCGGRSPAGGFDSRPPPLKRRRTRRARCHLTRPRRCAAFRAGSIPVPLRCEAAALGVFHRGASRHRLVHAVGKCPARVPFLLPQAR